MPNYDYRCTECRKKFTVQESFEEHERHTRVKCPKCGNENVPAAQILFTIGDHFEGLHIQRGRSR